MFGDNVTFGQAAIVCVFSMVVVFVVLLAISYLIDIIAWLLNRKKNTNKPQTPAQSVTPVQPAQPQSSHTDVVLVTAAIAAYLGKSADEIVVRNIRKVGTGETVWSCAGKLDALQ